MNAEELKIIVDGIVWIASLGATVLVVWLMFR